MTLPTTIWGHIDEVRDGLVKATLHDHLDRVYTAEIDLDRFADADQRHCQVGAQFTIKEPGPELKIKLRKQSVSGPAYGSDS